MVFERVRVSVNIIFVNINQMEYETYYVLFRQKIYDYKSDIVRHVINI